VALALVAGGVGAVVLGNGSSSSTSSAGASPVATSVPGAVPTDATPTAVDPGAPGEPDPQPEPLPEAQPDPGVLALNTSAIHLIPGDYSASFTVRNDGGSPLDWTWHAGITAIQVSQSSGTLAAGESVVVSFEINPFHLSEGGFVFINHVTSGDTTRNLTISGVRTPIVVNPDIPPGPQVFKS
jgi:hypothetical protein